MLITPLLFFYRLKKMTKKHTPNCVREEEYWHYYIKVPERGEHRVWVTVWLQLPWEVAGALSGDVNRQVIRESWESQGQRFWSTWQNYSFDDVLMMSIKNSFRRRQLLCNFPSKFTTIFSQPLRSSLKPIQTSSRENSGTFTVRSLHKPSAEKNLGQSRLDI